MSDNRQTVKIEGGCGCILILIFIGFFIGAGQALAGWMFG